MNLELKSGIYSTESLPQIFQNALKQATEIFHTGSAYTDKRNEFAAAVISDTTQNIYTGGNFLALNKSGDVASKECAEGTALAVARVTEGPEFALGAVVILNHVRDNAAEIQGQTFGPCDRCSANLIATTKSIESRRQAKSNDAGLHPTDEELSQVPVVSGVFDPSEPLGCKEVLVASLYELSSGEAVCVDTRQENTAIPLRLVHEPPKS